MKKVGKQLATEQALQKKLKSEGGHAKQLKAVGSAIKKAQKSQAKPKKRVSKLETKCPASGSTGSTTPHGRQLVDHHYSSPTSPRPRNT